MLWVHCSLCPPPSGFDFCIKSPKHCVHNNTMSVLWTKSIVGTHLEKHKTSVAKILLAIWVYLKLKFLFLFIRSLIKFSFCFKSWSTWGDWRDILIWVCWHFFPLLSEIKDFKEIEKSVWYACHISTCEAAGRAQWSWVQARTFPLELQKHVSG